MRFRCCHHRRRQRIILGRYPCPYRPIPPSRRVAKITRPCSRMAWRKTCCPEESSFPLDSLDFQPLNPNAWSWDLGKEEAKKFIEIFVSSTKKDEEKKMKFLESICTLCRQYSLLEDMDAFCHKTELAENIKVLLEEEPTDSLHTAFRRNAMETLTILSSTAKAALDGKKESLLHACFKSVFFLPPYLDMSAVEKDLYNKTMNAMEIMLQAFVRNCPISSVGEELQIIWQALLHYATSHNTAVRKIALQKIERLSDFLVTYLGKTSFAAGQCEGSPGTHKEVHIPILGQLLGHLFISSCGTDPTRYRVLDALYHFYAFLKDGRECSLTKDMENYAERRKNLKDTAFPFTVMSTPCDIAKAFGGYLRPSERTDIILTATEAMRDSSIHDKQGACSLLDAALEDPKYWLTDVPTIMEGIRKNLDSIHTASARRCLDSLLLQLTNLMSREEVKNLLQFSPPSDSTALGMWEVVLAMPQTLQKVLNALMEDLPLRNWCTAVTEDTCIRRLAMLAQNHVSEEEFGNPVHLQSYLKHPSPAMRLMALKGLSTVSESPEKARKIQVVLPDILEALQDTNADVVLKALLVLRNVMARVERREAGRTALQLAEKLLPLFDHESSQVREHSICLFQAVTEAVLRQRKRALKRTVHSSLLPLYFRMRDQSESVAKLQQDGGRVEEYLQQSQPYLQDSQTVLRLEAVRFIGLAARYSGDQSEEKQNEIISVLRSSGKDVEPMVRCLAAQTIMILASRRNRTSGRRFRQLWCC
ncbi:maestro heat-like repeat-containing protein family member 7 isoform X2 [Anser cygnoides]|uniref:maestro heat-like repeat-containing protein family member 7 isoform X2 n=1 Tax=Anser cygnoides TaxID=8845 RepID=UPI0034D2BA32